MLCLGKYKIKMFVCKIIFLFTHTNIKTGLFSTCLSENAIRNKNGISNYAHNSYISILRCANIFRILYIFIIISAKFFKVKTSSVPYFVLLHILLPGHVAMIYGNGAPPVLLYLIGCLDTGLTSAEE